MTNKELLTVLLEQHKELKNILLDIEKDLNNPNLDVVKTLNSLNEFNGELVAHLQLEDGTFYPEVLKIIKDNQGEIKKTEEFIAQMKVLGVLVFGFLNKYNSKENILADMTEFKREFEDMTGKILLRVTMEEEGVYMYLA